MVRLEVVASNNMMSGSMDFNSSMVRLEDLKEEQPVIYYIQFQFQYGAIRRKISQRTCHHTQYISIPVWCD